MYFLTRHDYVGLIYQLLTGILFILLCDINQRVENPLKELAVNTITGTEKQPKPQQS